MFMRKFHKPQTNLPDAVVIRKINKWTIERYKIKSGVGVAYAISNGDKIYYANILPEGVWSSSGHKIAYEGYGYSDNPYPIPKTVRMWFEKYIEPIYY